jgi:hypothetical protein
MLTLPVDDVGVGDHLGNLRIGLMIYRDIRGIT